MRLSFIFTPGLIAVLVLLLAPQGEAMPVEVKADVSGTLPILGQFHTYINLEALVNPPNKWTYQAPAPSNAIISLRIGLKLQNVERFQQMVIDLSTPGHPNFGQHMTQNEIDAIINPAKESAPLVLEWLKSFGIKAFHDGQWVKADVTVAQAQGLLQTRFGVYLNTASNEEVIRTLSYNVPGVLKHHVDFIQPTTMFGLELLRPRVSTDNLERRSVPAVNDPAVNDNDDSHVKDCSRSVTPECLRKLYNMEGVNPHSNVNSELAVAGFLGEYGNRADLQTFFKGYRPEVLGRSYRTTLVSGGLDNQTKPGVEANLDIQYTTGLVPPEAVQYYSVGEKPPPPFKPDVNTVNNTNEPYDLLLEFLFKRDKVPDTLSMSYADYEQTVPESYAKRICTLFAKLGGMGTTVLVASGDYGVGGNDPLKAEDCLTNDGQKKVKFQPLFPSGCPFVTTVGGTVGISPETAATLSGGGFSEYFEVPSWQSSDVGTYLSKLGSKYHGLFNTAGRAYPDVSGQAQHYQVVVGGKVKSVAGTSASTPVFATMVWYINDERRSQGKGPLGFLNPMLYANPNALNDIELGSNPGCGTNGFDAIAGWDPVTGLGTPNLKKLIAALAPHSK